MFSVVKWLEVYLELDRSFASFANWAQEPVSRMFPLLPGPELFFWFVFKTELSMVLEVIQ